jgi:hypothetical protein
MKSSALRPALLVRLAAVGCTALLGMIPSARGEDKEKDKVFSGPQLGEKLSSFKAVGVFDEQAGKELDLVKVAGGKPLVLVFVHEFNRPSLATVRAVMGYAAPKAKDGKLVAGVVLLTADTTATEELLKRARRALPQDVPITISPDGLEGPGTYGLNRKMTLTVLVAKENKVTANFALIQPSVQADSPKIAAAIADVLGIKPPTAKELGLDGAAKTARPKGKAAGQDPNLAPLLRAVIRKDASKEDVDEAAKKLAEYIEKNREAAAQVGQIAQRIVDSGNLENYGTKEAQQHIRTWAKKYGEKK